MLWLIYKNLLLNNLSNVQIVKQKIVLKLYIIDVSIRISNILNDNNYENLFHKDKLLKLLLLFYMIN